MEFAEVRPYVPGDDYRNIEWNVSARLATPFVKTFTEERELTLLLIVDQSGSTRFGEPVTKAALAVEVAAVLALAAARHNDRVGALLFSDSRSPRNIVATACLIGSPLSQQPAQANGNDATLGATTMLLVCPDSVLASVE